MKIKSKQFNSSAQYVFVGLVYGLYWPAKISHTCTHWQPAVCVSQTETDRCSMPYVDLVKRSALSWSHYSFQVESLALSSHSHYLYRTVSLHIKCQEISCCISPFKEVTHFVLNGRFIPKSKAEFHSFSPAMLHIHVDCFGVSCRVLEMFSKESGSI